MATGPRRQRGQRGRRRVRTRQRGRLVQSAQRLLRPELVRAQPLLQAGFAVSDTWERRQTMEPRRSRERAAVEAVVEGGDFHLVYQPIVHLDTGEVAGVEALCRF